MPAELMVKELCKVYFYYEEEDEIGLGQFTCENILSAIAFGIR